LVDLILVDEIGERIKSKAWLIFLKKRGKHKDIERQSITEYLNGDIQDGWTDTFMEECTKILSIDSQNNLLRIYQDFFTDDFAMRLSKSVCLATHKSIILSAANCKSQIAECFWSNRLIT
jgi:hypothetical protein